ncbi:hypothetical protein GCM10011581_20660 [Saccharopolyspora subtropica]|uniref:Uncharacterized protein n=1 Tax=Saccharopolyspora thermophila TaxID=89367 RepID=A0A917NC77_9PSEU|nr:hypothetical protein GCM10011581_20660 [Saccharopolyspora subtropica]
MILPRLSARVKTRAARPNTDLPLPAAIKPRRVQPQRYGVPTGGVYVAGEPVQAENDNAVHDGLSSRVLAPGWTFPSLP